MFRHRVAGVGHVAERCARRPAAPHLPGEAIAAAAGLPAGVEAARDAHHHRQAEALRRGKRLRYHPQPGARRRRLQHRQLEQIGQCPRILIVLRPVGAGIVAGDDHHPAAEGRQVQRHQGIDHHVQADALGAHQGAPSAEAGADRYLQRYPLVGGPFQMAAGAFAGAQQLDQRRYGRRAGRAGIGGDATDAGARRAVGQRLAAGSGLRNLHAGLLHGGR